MLQNRIVYYRDARFFKRPLVNHTMELVIAQMVKVDIAFAQFYRAGCTKGAQEGRGVIRYAGSRGRERRKKTKLQTFFRGPNNAVPMRTMVAPSSMATSRSCDMPIDRCFNPLASASSRSLAK